MEWHLAGYDSHPIDGDAASVASLAAHLVALTGEVRSHMDQLRTLDSSDVWESTSGSAEDFQAVVGNLPQKLELVATRYEAVTATLDGFHPVLANTKQDAEYWIQEAAAAQAEVERAEGGIELMVEHEGNAERVADTTNAERAPGDAEVEPDPWPGEDYHATLAAAQTDLAQAVANVQSAVQEFRESGDSGAQAILDAANDALAQPDGWFSDVFGFGSDRYGFRPDENGTGGTGTVIPAAGTDPASIAEWWASSPKRPANASSTSTTQSSESSGAYPPKTSTRSTANASRKTSLA